jgi:hypothetical protein
MTGVQMVSRAFSRGFVDLSALTLCRSEVST